MSQADVFKLLGKLKDDEWMSTTEIVSILGHGRSTIIANLCKLRKFNEIQSRKINKSVRRNQECEHRLTVDGEKCSDYV